MVEIGVESLHLPCHIGSVLGGVQGVHPRAERALVVGARHGQFHSALSGMDGFLQAHLPRGMNTDRAADVLGIKCCGAVACVWNTPGTAGINGSEASAGWRQYMSSV
jgi:hypothetical protein